MICPTCGKMNEDGFKFCVKCGSNIEVHSEVNYDSVDMGGYHTEEEFAEGHHSGFVMGTGVFRISDRPVTNESSDVYTSDELNDTDEEFDFSMFDEPDKPDTSGFGTFGSAPLPPPKTIDNTLVDEDEDDEDIAAAPAAFAPPPARRQEQLHIPRQPQHSYQQPASAYQGGGYGQSMPQHQMNQPQMTQQQPSQMNQGYGSSQYQQQMSKNFGSQQYQQNGYQQPQPQYQQPAAQFGAPAMQQPQPQSSFGAQQPVQSQMMYGQPQQIIGYDKSGQPIYGQPQMMYAQPQIIGYDKSGQPIYGQPQMMYAQPQIIGYDKSGQPIFGQPQMMFMQPQIIGYDKNGQPIFGQPPVGMQSESAQSQPMGMMNSAMSAPPVQQQSVSPAPDITQQQPEKEEKTDFWDFFDDGKKDTSHEKPKADDFFGKSSHSDGMGDLSADGLDMSRLRRTEKKKRDYMGDTPLVDASALNPNDAAKFNKFYMKATEEVNADDLQAHSTGHSQDRMGMTAQVDASMLSQNVRMRSRISMGGTDMVDASDLQAYTPERSRSIMGEADHAVEALPKKRNPYQSELDLIELPEYMKAKKTSREDSIEIPSLPKV